MKTLRFNVGDRITLDARGPTMEGKLKGVPGTWTEYQTSQWDVIKVNKKSIIVQNFPTYERRKIRRFYQP